MLTTTRTEPWWYSTEPPSISRTFLDRILERPGSVEMLLRDRIRFRRPLVDLRTNVAVAFVGTDFHIGHFDARFGQRLALGTPRYGRLPFLDRLQIESRFQLRREVLVAV